MVKGIFLLSLIGLLACGDSPCPPMDPIDGGAGGNPPAPMPDPSYCQPPPYAELNGPGFRSWASPTCSGDIARGEFATGNNDALVHRCAQWLPSGEVWCVDPSAPVPAIYFKDPNQNGLCIEWTASAEPWFIWRPCGVKPIVGSI